MICKFPSDQFYESVLQADDSVMGRKIVEELSNFWPEGISCPIVFCDMVGKEKEFLSSSDITVKQGLEHRRGRKTDPHSKCNPEEAKKAVCAIPITLANVTVLSQVKIARALRRRLHDRLASIGIITPYRAQKDRVEEELTSDDLKVSVHTINECQGKSDSNQLQYNVTD